MDNSIKALLSIIGVCVGESYCLLKKQDSMAGTTFVDYLKAEQAKDPEKWKNLRWIHFDGTETKWPTE